MKYCPSCQTRYADDSLQFCLQDGTQLSNFPSAEAFSTTENVDEEQTLVKNRLPQITEQYETNPLPPPAPVVKKSRALPAILLTALAMLLLFGIGGIAAWLYFRDNDEVAREANKNAARNQNVAVNKAEPSPTPTPKTSPTATPEDENTQSSPTPANNADPEEVKKEVSRVVNTWKSQTESRSLAGYMSLYADTVDYYTKPNTSVGTVRNDKQRAFSRYNNIEMDISNMRVTPEGTGDRATAVFDKEWVFEGENDYSAGKVQSQLQLRKINGEWKIVGERDLKVYYVE